MQSLISNEYRARAWLIVAAVFVVMLGLALL